MFFNSLGGHFPFLKVSPSFSLSGICTGLARVVSCVNFQPFGSKSPMQVSFDYLSHAGSHKASLSGLWYLLVVGGGDEHQELQETPSTRVTRYYTVTGPAGLDTGSRTTESCPHS